MAAGFAAASLFFVLSAGASSAQKSSAKLQAAQTQFRHAEEERAELNSKASADRTLADYKKVVAAYRRVALATPRAPGVPEAFFAIGELDTEMGDRFGRAYYQSAVDAYQFLAHEYPENRHRQDALLRIAQLQKDRLGDSALAAKTYEEFLKLYPRSSHRREVQEALAELALLQRNNNSETNEAPKLPAVSATRANEKSRDAAPAPPAAPGELPHVRKISTSASAEATRLIIELDRKTAYTSARIRNPERIYFDFQAARLPPAIARHNVRVSGDLLKSVRIAQNPAGVVRVVLEVAGVADYGASLTDRPPQLIVDLYPAKPALRASRKEPGAEKAAALDSPDARSEISSHEAGNSPVSAAVQPSAADRSNSSRKPIIGPLPPEPVPVNNTSLTHGGAGSASRGGAAQPTPQPTRDGQSTLTRTLGLKIGRIVIDPGHGGHDTGTIGPSGLTEKDLCLDVAARLGKIIEQRLPGADVVFTRTDDSFVPLERRTEIANETKADLFISIHANSSQNQDARGIETYYLNLKGTPEAMDVAARENATASGGVHDLQDVVKKIARTEKIEESREFARDIQDSLSKRIQKSGRSFKNRGVRKAPFVVLIGADMPSILTEISFLSNPSDEQLLKKPDYRQRVAEGLYQGIARYLQSLNSVTYNLPQRAPSGRSPSASIPVEQSRNQQ